MLTAAAAFTLTSCVGENPFLPDDNGMGYGRVLTSSLAVQLQEVETRAEDESSVLSVDKGKFTVEFYKVADEETVINIEDEEPVYMYTYKKMPEIVTLPAGVNYRVVAYYGDNDQAAWNAPYYEGKSEMFKVEADQIVDSISPIVCKLSNVMVSVNFDESLAGAMSDDSEVSVMSGEHNNGLEFKKNTKGSAFFRYVEGSALTATFDGTVNGEKMTQVSTITDVEPGVHYIITFRLQVPNASGSGSLSTDVQGEENKGFVIQGVLNVEDLTGEGIVNLDPDQEYLLGADDIILPPSQGEDEPGTGDDPNNPTDPENPDEPNTPAGNGPTVTAEDPINLDERNLAYDGLHCVLNVHSDSGITEFKVKIDSETLTEDILGAVGLATSFDLINPATNKMKEGLASINLPVGDEVEGKNDVKFDISTFMSLLGVYGTANHDFILTISDASGTTTVDLKLRTVKES